MTEQTHFWRNFQLLLYFLSELIRIFSCFPAHRASVVRLTLPTPSNQNDNEQDSQSQDNFQIAYHTTYHEDKPTDRAAQESVTLRCLNGNPLPLKAKAPKFPLAFDLRILFPPPDCGGGPMCKYPWLATCLLGPNWAKSAPKLTKLPWGPQGVNLFAFWLSWGPHLT